LTVKEEALEVPTTTRCGGGSGELTVKEEALEVPTTTPRVLLTGVLHALPRVLPEGVESLNSDGERFV
jgi:hypothetical protein